MAERQVIRPEWPWAERFRIAQAVRAGNVIYVAGQVAMSPEGEIVGRGDMKEQARQVFGNIREVLGMAGGEMSDVVKLTAYLTDFSQFDGFAEARREAFPEVTFASTGVEVSGLVDPDLLVEVEAIAHIGDQ